MLDKFEKSISGLSDNTIKSYTRNVKSFLEYQKEKYNEDDPTAIVEMDIKNYQQYLLNNGRASSTVATHLHAIRKYCEFLNENGYLEHDVSKGVKVNRVETATAPQVMTRDEFNKFRRAVATTDNKLYIAIVEVLIATGVRVNELTSLRLDDVELSERKGKITVRNGKGNVSRTIPINNDARKAVEDYLTVRKDVESDRLFIGQRGAMSDDGIRKLLSRMAKRAHLEHLNITPHLFRHQLATELIRNKKKDLVLVKDILGHADITTLHVYSKSTEDEQAQALEDLYL